MTPTDAPDIEAITARLAAITPPPWILLPPLCGPDGQGVYNEDGGCICEVGDPYPRGDNHPQANMTFIAHAPADIAALLALVDAAYATTQYFQMRGRTDEQDHARIALDSALRALGIDPDAHPTDEARIARALERGRKALEEGG